MKYKRRNLYVEAFRYDGDMKDAEGRYYVPEWAVEALKKRVMFYDAVTSDSPPCELYVKNMFGIQHVSVDDYVVREDDGEIFAYRPHAFEKLYDIEK